MDTKAKGILLIDRGIPRDLSKESLKRYYFDLLCDKSTFLGSKLLRNFLIKSAIIPWNINKWYTKHRRFWSNNGFIGRTDVNQNIEILQKMLKQSHPSIEWTLELASLYGEHSIENAVIRMKLLGVQEIIVVPLFPQWSQSTRGKIENIVKNLKNENEDLNYKVIPSFYDLDEIIMAQSELLIDSLPHQMDETVAVVSAFRIELPPTNDSLLPVCRKCINKENECRPDSFSKSYCYRFQCFDAAEKINEKSKLLNWNVAFHQTQENSSNTMSPSLQEITEHLLEQGYKTIVIQCPSIIYNDIETINDIGVELREYFLNNGGKKFILVPPLGRSVHWLPLLKRLILSHCDLKVESSDLMVSPTPLLSIVQ